MISETLQLDLKNNLCLHSLRSNQTTMFCFPELMKNILKWKKFVRMFYIRVRTTGKEEKLRALQIFTSLFLYIYLFKRHEPLLCLTLGGCVPDTNQSLKKHQALSLCFKHATLSPPSPLQCIFVLLRSPFHQSIPHP